VPATRWWEEIDPALGQDLTRRPIDRLYRHERAFFLADEKHVKPGEDGYKSNGIWVLYQFNCAQPVARKAYVGQHMPNPPFRWANWFVRERLRSRGRGRGEPDRPPHGARRVRKT
jgi:hypothetical protein